VRTVGRVAAVVAVAVLAAAMTYATVVALQGPSGQPVPAIDLDRLPPPDRQPVEVPADTDATVLPPPTAPPVTTPPATTPPATTPPPPPPPPPDDDDDGDDDGPEGDDDGDDDADDD
jgi:hypothetical protein